MKEAQKNICPVHGTRYLKKDKHGNPYCDHKDHLFAERAK